VAKAERREVDRVELPARHQQVVGVEVAVAQLAQHAAVEPGEGVGLLGDERHPSLGAQQRRDPRAADGGHRAEGGLDVVVEAVVGW
jgi:hypothetical protein